LAPFQVKATEHVPEEYLQAFASKLRPRFEVEVDESRAFFKSVTAPSWVHVLQTPEFWLQTLAGNVAWDAVKGAISDRAKIRENIRSVVSGAVLDFSVALALLRDKLASETAIWIGCPVPNDWFSTLMLIKAGAAEDIAADLTLFLLHLPSLEKFYLDHEDELAGQVTLTLAADGDMVVDWMDEETLTSQRSRFPLRDVA
jgi:hypothetical protein